MNKLVMKWALLLTACLTLLITIYNALHLSASDTTTKSPVWGQGVPYYRREGGGAIVDGVYRIVKVDGADTPLAPPVAKAAPPVQGAAPSVQGAAPEGAEEYFFVIMTKSLPQDESDRVLLREKSWLSHDWRDDEGRAIAWRHFFFVGLSMDPAWPRSKALKEHEKYGDIVIIPTLDMQTRLTFKLMKALQWSIDNLKFTFLIVVDEDTIVNVNGLNRHLRGIVAAGKSSMFYGGYECGKKDVFRSGKFANSVEKWPPKQYPRFCTGTGVIYAFDTIVELCDVWDKDRQPNLDIDDTHQGVLIWMSGKIDVTEISNITRGCHGKRSDTFIVTQIKPLTVGVQIMNHFLETGIYCDNSIRGH